MNEFTPSNDNLRDAWRAVRTGKSWDEACAEFNRWLDAHDQGIRDAVERPELTAKEHLEAAWEAAYPVPKGQVIPAGKLFIVRHKQGQFTTTTVDTPSIPTSWIRTLTPLPPVIPDDCDYVWASVSDDRGDRSIWTRTSDGRWESRMPRSNCTVRYPEDDLIDPKPVPEEER